MVGVYVGREIEESLQKIEKWERREEKMKVLVGGDFNARTGRERQNKRGRNGKDRKRRKTIEGQENKWGGEKAAGIRRGKRIELV